jgi:hypothetical protein
LQKTEKISKLPPADTSRMMKINVDIKPVELSKKLERFWELSAEKIFLI